jgi:hypothetical protein
MLGGNKAKAARTLKKSGAVGGCSLTGNPTGFGGHFRAVQGFRYYGEAGKK